jgi:hypothetical protein
MRATGSNSQPRRPDDQATRPFGTSEVQPTILGTGRVAIRKAQPVVAIYESALYWNKGL